jgi:hypothetical protein
MHLSTVRFGVSLDFGRELTRQARVSSGQALRQKSFWRESSRMTSFPLITETLGAENVRPDGPFRRHALPRNTPSIPGSTSKA